MDIYRIIGLSVVVLAIVVSLIPRTAKSPWGYWLVSMAFLVVAVGSGLRKDFLECFGELLLAIIVGYRGISYRK
jgi:hypothetical protein